MSEHLTNEEIREKLMRLNYNCGPITDTTRQVYLKKLETLKSRSGDLKTDLSEKITDGELRSQLIALGFSPGPITSQNRNSYFKKLESLKFPGNKSSTEDCSLDNNNKNTNENVNPVQMYDAFVEPMDID